MNLKEWKTIRIILLLLIMGMFILTFFEYVECKNTRELFEERIGSATCNVCENSPGLDDLFRGKE